MINSRLGLFTAGACAPPLIPKLRGQFAEFLNYPSPVGLRILFLTTCVGLRYGHHFIYTRLFSPPSKHTSLLNFGPLRPSLPIPGICPSRVSPCLNLWWLRNFNRMCIDYAFRPHLSSRLTRSGRTFLLKPEAFGHYDSHINLATHSGSLTSIKSTAAYATTSPLMERSPTHHQK